MKLRWLFWLLVIAAIWVVISQFTQIQNLVQTLIQGQWQWVLAAAFVQVIYYFFYTGIIQSAFQTVEVESKIGELIPVVFASFFVNVAAPTGGASGAALFVDDAARRGQSPARATAGVLLTAASQLTAFLPVLLVGLFYLFRQHDLQVYEIIGSLILVLLVVILSMIFLFGLRHPTQLRELLYGLQKGVNWFGSRIKLPHLLKDDWAEKNSNEFIEAAIAIAAHPLRLRKTILIALCAHLVDLSSIYVLFLAFHQPVGFGILIAGYAMGILFWIVSITPQGIGVVEGTMTLVFASLGVPVERAAIIALTFRGLTFWLPFGIGFLLLRRVKAFTPKERIRSEVWSVRTVSILTGLMGVINVISAITPTASSRIHRVVEYSPFGINHGGHLASALSGFALLMLAWNLWRRKRVAWLLTIIVLVISAISHLLKGFEVLEAGLAAGLALWLFYLSRHFHARSDDPSIKQGIQTLAAALVFTLAYGVSGFYFLDHHFRVNFGLGAAVRQTVIMFTQFYDPGLQPITGFGRYFAGSIYIVGTLTFAYALIMLVRPVLVRHPASAEERMRAKAVVEAFGCSSLARLTLLDDKQYFFSPGGSVLAFVVKGRAALVLGDPIGPFEDVPSSIIAFQAYCRGNDWEPAFYQASPDYLDYYRRLGFNAVCIGHEAIVDLSKFTLSGRANKGLRSGVNRLERLGYTSQLIEPPLSHSLLRVLSQISDEWLTSVNGTEKRFALGWFDTDYIRRSRVILIRDPEQEIVAFANILPEYQNNEVGIDLMRHRQESEHGLMDYLFTSLFQWAIEQDYSTFNLGLSALSGIGEHPEDPAIERALHYIFEHVNQFYNFKGLHEFKSKFHPIWSPRYLIYPGTANLPLVTIALIRADSGDDMWGSYFQKS